MSFFSKSWNMKALILAAGFGTRLGKDLRNDTSGAYSHLLGQLEVYLLSEWTNWVNFRIWLVYIHINCRMHQCLMWFAGIPKPLLPIGKKPLISHWLDVLCCSKVIDKVYVIVSIIFEFSQVHCVSKLFFFSFNAHQLTIPSAFCVSLLEFFFKEKYRKIPQFMYDYCGFAWFVALQTNGANHEKFVEWSKDWPQVSLLSDGCLTNEVH